MFSRQQKPHNMSRKRYLMKRSTPFFGNFFGMIAKVSLVREVIVISKEIGPWQLPKSLGGPSR